jgi:hypothetical protein
VAITVQLTESLESWGTPGFEDTLKREIERLGAGQLPLQQGLTTGSYALGEGLSATIVRVTEEPSGIRVRAGVFYTSLIAGCSCADDPTPVEPQPEYCEVELRIEKATGLTAMVLVGEG